MIAFRKGGRGEQSMFLVNAQTFQTRSNAL
jgi:hypothetical protein